MSLSRRRKTNEDGFALLYVMMVTTVILLSVTATVAVVSPNFSAGKRSQNVGAAELAAQSGINDALAYLMDIPACRSETRVCPQALGTSSTQTAANSYTEPTLGNNEHFSWTTNPSLTSDGFVRVTSTGTSAYKTPAAISRTLVADLSLNPSILKYGYYTNYESQSPTYINSYDGKRNIYVNNSTTFGDISSNYSSGSAPSTVNWNGAGNNPPSGYSDSVCGQHWYSDGANSPGRGNAANGSTWAESGTLNSKTVYNIGSCDLVFTAGMIENGPTYTRDAIDIANGSGNGPVFNQPVYTLWGYPGDNSPAVSTSPWRQSDGTGNDLLTNSPYKPQVASQDITLPTSIGTDGVQTNSCVYYGPTRVVLNGDGTATVTSPDTTTAAQGADAGCYPSSLGSSGINGFTLNYAAIGSGTIYVKNLNTPSPATWPVTTLKSTSTPSASNEVFWLPTTGNASPDASSSVAPSNACSGSTAYSATPNATCSWTNLPNGTNQTAASKLGWTADSSTAKCNTAIAATNRQLFECEYSNTTGATVPTPDDYASFRTAVQNYLAAGTCATDTIPNQVSCIQSGLDTGVLPTANTGQHAYNYASPANGDHQYYAVSASGTATSATKTLTATNPMSNDSMFSYSGTNGAEKSTATPITTTVYRQTYSSSSKSWGTGVPQFTFTITHTDWSVTNQPSGVDYFPGTQDVTAYSMGSTSAGVAAGTTASSQPGDLYVQGVNKGILSLIAQNNVELTGDITKGAGNDTSAANPVSVTAGNDIRNYHPVSCVDQAAADINNTSAGWCPNDISGIYSGTLLNNDGSFTAQHPAAQYTNILGTGVRTIDAALFSLSGSLRTENYNRGAFVGNLNVNGGIYQDFRGANGVNYSNGSNTPGHAGTSLNYTYVDLERANLQYVPTANYSSNPRVWNVVSTSAGMNLSSAGS